MTKVELNGPIARRFPLVARIRPVCLPLSARVGKICEFADAGARDADPGLASTAFNQAALVASDVGLPDLARAWCHRHATAYLPARPLPKMAAIRALEPLVNLARLHIRAGRGDDGRRLLLDLFNAISKNTEVVLDSITIPAGLTRTEAEHHEVREWLWRVLLADGTRALTAAGRWTEALDHVEQHRGVGNRMLDGRQVALFAALASEDTQRTLHLLATTTPGEAWEQNVTSCLTALFHRHLDQPYEKEFVALSDAYQQREPEPGLAVFDARLGLSVLDAAEGAASEIVDRITNEMTIRAIAAQDGYAAREILTHSTARGRMPKHEAENLRGLVRSCGLGERALPTELHARLQVALEKSSEVVKQTYGP
ncbi:hypothetical protein [Streptomyces abikoensis]|uniref:XRE family transcriptional regulator n=1 Tax=Streptomyces abikoensis TaxID=97398 RepID=A0ABW7T4T6_9ACTN